MKETLTLGWCPFMKQLHERCFMAETESVWNSGWAYFMKFFRGVKISVNCSSIFHLQRTSIDPGFTATKT